MCRWIAYSGTPIYLESLILRPENSLISQSRQAWLGHSATNGDGFGIGWYGERPEPGVFRDILPAWNDENLASLSAQIRSHLFFGHVRASTGSATQRVNCHPFRCGRWLFMHNGRIAGFERIRRELALAIAPEFFPHLLGTTDSEAFFYLLLSNGLDDDPEAALRRTVGQVLAAMRDAALPGPFQMTAALSDGRTVFALRYASDHEAPSLFYGCGARPRDEAGTPVETAGDALLILSEPLDRVEAQWTEVPESRILIAGDGGIALSGFEPE